MTAPSLPIQVTEAPPHIVCRRCGVTKPFTAENFHRHASASGGLRKVCRICINGGYAPPLGRPRSAHTEAILAGEYAHHTCPRCGARLPFTSDHFPRNKNLSGGLRKTCRNCMRRADREGESRRQLEWRKRNPGKFANTARRANARMKLKRYGMSYEQYEEMQREQDGRCAICGERETTRNKLDGTIRALHLDHCHATGKARALLCQRCNLAVGHVRDSPEICRKMAAYLEEHAHGR